VVRNEFQKNLIVWKRGSTYPIGVFQLTAGFIKVLKQGDPINWAFSAVSGLLGKVDGSLTQY